MTWKRGCYGTALVHIVKFIRKRCRPMANDNGEVYYLPPSLARSPRHQDDDLIVFRGDDVAMYASYACSYAPFDNAPYAYDWTFTNHHYEEVDTG